MALAQTRTRTKQHGHHAAEEDLVILEAVVELEPYAAADQQKRSRWQQVARRVIAETGHDEVSGDYCKGRYATLLETAPNVGQEERGKGGADSILALALKTALVKHREWEDRMSMTSPCGVEESSSSDVSPASRAGRSSLRGSVHATPSRVVSPSNTPLGGPEGKRRELLSRVAAARAREKKRTKPLTSRTASSAMSSVVLSSLIEEMTEERERAPKEQGVQAKETDATTDRRDHPSESLLQSEASSPHVEPPKPLPQQRRSFLETMFQRVWSTGTRAGPEQDAMRDDPQVSSAVASAAAAASARDTSTSRGHSHERSVAGLTPAPSLKDVEMEDGPCQATEPRDDKQSLGSQLAAERASNDACHAKLKQELQKQQQQNQGHLGRMEQTLATLTASFSEFQDATMKRTHQNELRMLKLHSQTQLELRELKKTVAEQQANESRSLLQQLQQLEATTTMTRENEV